MLMEMVSRLLLLFSLLPADEHGSESSSQYAVVFDAGSTGSRVHLFSFDKSLELLPVGSDYEFFLATTPGLSSYENDPIAGADSLKPLLQQAEALVPNPSRPYTPLRLGATAGLRQLPPNSSQAIIEAVRDVFQKESTLLYKPEWVSILDGTDEGAYQWVAINYLIGSLGKQYSKTVGVVDLGGGSVQIAYAISDESASNAPSSTEEAYVVDKFVVGAQYHIYTHSYLNYGLKAARAQALNLTALTNGNPCVTNGYKGTYAYSGVSYDVSPPRSGTSFKKCAKLIEKVLRIDAACTHRNCSFNGVWNGGGGAGLQNLYVASFYYDTAAESGIVEADASKGSVRPREYRNVAKKACKANVDNIKSIFPLIDKRDIPFLCMDLLYEYTLLVHGFGVDPFTEITVVKSMEYKGSSIEAAWPLGCAVELLSSVT